MQEDDLKKLIEKEVKRILPEYLRTKAFTARKVTDTPTDDLQVTPRGYVNKYGSTVGRPSSSVVGQQYFDTTIGRPLFKNSNGAWVDGAGSIS